MGTFHVEGEVAATATPDEFVPVERMLVDSGAEFSWIQERILQEAGVTVAKKDQRFLTADGKTVTRSMGYAFLRSSGFETVDEVVFARPGDLTILGARTLEGFGAVVDAGKKRLAASGPHLAAPGGGDEP
jgi:predicted aspartyl protease